MPNSEKNKPEGPTSYNPRKESNEKEKRTKTEFRNIGKEGLGKEDVLNSSEIHRNTVQPTKEWTKRSYGKSQARKGTGPYLKGLTWTEGAGEDRELDRAPAGGGGDQGNSVKAEKKIKKKSETTNEKQILIHPAKHNLKSKKTIPHENVANAPHLKTGKETANNWSACKRPRNCLLGKSGHEHKRLSTVLH